MSLKRVLVTGATGCVGHYVVEALLARGDCQPVLWARDPAKLQLPAELRTELEWIVDDVQAVEAHRKLLAGLDAVVHVATAWGDAIAYPTNVDATLALAAATDGPFLYFSTASILDGENRPLAIAESQGTDYIRSKYLAHQALRAGPHAGRVTTLFPTIVFGGSNHHPISHASRGLPRLVDALWLLRRLTIDGSFHFIHAADIARIVSHLLDTPRPGADLVLGNPWVTASGLLDQLCAHYGLPREARFDVTPLAEWLATLVGARMSSWDRVCLEQRHFRYNALAPRSFGLEPGLETVSQILADLDPRGPTALGSAC